MGQLTQVEIVIGASAGVGDVTLQIQTTSSVTDQPTGAVLGSVTIPAASVPLGTGQNLSFDFSTQPLTLVPGVSLRDGAQFADLG